MGYAQRGGDPPCVMDVLPSTTSTLAEAGLAMIVKLERYAHYIKALPGKETSDDRRIDATGHRHDDARVLGALGNIKRVQHFSF
jgi:hypothetical protein